VLSDYDDKGIASLKTGISTIRTNLKSHKNSVSLAKAKRSRLEEYAAEQLQKTTQKIQDAENAIDDLLELLIKDKNLQVAMNEVRKEAGLDLPQYSCIEELKQLEVT
jgi:replicative DNA helicase